MPVATREMMTAIWPKTGRRANVSMMAETMPVPGMKMM